MTTHDDKQQWLAMLAAAKPGQIVPKGLLDTLITFAEAREALPQHLHIRPVLGGLLIEEKGSCPWCNVARLGRYQFDMFTAPIGAQDDGDGGALSLGNCKRCGSTIACEAPQ